MALNLSHLLIAFTMLMSSASGAIIDEAAVPVPDAVSALDFEIGEETGRDKVVLDRFDRAEMLERSLDRGQDHLMILEAYSDYDERSMSDADLDAKIEKVRAHLTSIEACLADESECKKPAKFDAKTGHEKRIHEMKAERISAIDAKVDRPVASNQNIVMREMVAACFESEDCTVEAEDLRRMAFGGDDREDVHERGKERGHMLIRRCLSHLGEDRATEDIDREQVAERVRTCVHRFSDDRAHDAWGERDEIRNHDRKMTQEDCERRGGTWAEALDRNGKHYCEFEDEEERDAAPINIR